MSTTTTTPVTTSFASVIAALRDVHDEASLWHLSDELAKAIPQGDVTPVVAAATAAGIPVRSANTLRLYRDVAVRFPAANRVPNVSFSAHREALTIGKVEDAADLLNDLVKQHGMNVTVTTVRKAVQAQTGKGVQAAAGVGKAGAAVKLTWAEVITDLVGGGKGLLAQVDAVMAGTNGVTLDTLHSGVSKVLADVEARRVKAARAAAKAKTAATSSKAPVKPTPKPGKAPVKTAGDLRDL